MRIKGSDLKRIIKEEISRMNDSSLTEAYLGGYRGGSSYSRSAEMNWGVERDDPMPRRTRAPTPMKGAGPTWGEGSQGLDPKKFDQEVDNKFRLGGEFLKELLGSVVSGGARFGRYKIERPAHYNDWRATVTVTTEEGSVGTAQSERFGGYFNAISKAIDETEGVDPEFLSSEYEP